MTCLSRGKLLGLECTQHSINSLHLFRRCFCHIILHTNTQDYRKCRYPTNFAKYVTTKNVSIVSTNQIGLRASTTKTASTLHRIHTSAHMNPPFTQCTYESTPKTTSYVHNQKCLFCIHHKYRALCPQQKLLLISTTKNAPNNSMPLKYPQLQMSHMYPFY